MVNIDGSSLINGPFYVGYEFKMPFLDDDCGIRIEQNYIIPLYKHCINAMRPTMAVIGYVFTSAITQMIDIQANIIDTTYSTQQIHEICLHFAGAFCYGILEWKCDAAFA